MKMKTNSLLYLLGFALGATLAVFIGLLIEAWVLGIIFSWFGITLTIWQNLVIVLLANAICNPSLGLSRK